MLWETETLNLFSKIIHGNPFNHFIVSSSTPGGPSEHHDTPVAPFDRRMGAKALQCARCAGDRGKLVFGITCCFNDA